MEAERLTAEGVKIIIVLSHCGLDPDREIAKFGGPIDIIVGGHSHSFLWSGDDPPGPDSVVDNYPVVEKQDNGRDVLIVQASAYTKYLGDIVLYFDEDGIIQDYEGAPIFLGTDVSQDPAILEELEPWKAAVASVQDRVIGNSKFDYSSTRCYTKECGMGSLTADANAYAVSFINNLCGEEFLLNFPSVLRQQRRWLDWRNSRLGKPWWHSSWLGERRNYLRRLDNHNTF